MGVLIRIHLYAMVSVPGEAYRSRLLYHPLADRQLYSFRRIFYSSLSIMVSIYCRNGRLLFLYGQMGFLSAVRILIHGNDAFPADMHVLPERAESSSCCI